MLLTVPPLLQAALGSWALCRSIAYPSSLDSLRDIGRFLLIVPLTLLVNAILSMALFWLFGVVAAHDLLLAALPWWVSDSLGILLAFPLCLIVAGEPRTLWRSRTKPLGLPILLTSALVTLAFVKSSQWEQERLLSNFRQ